MKNDRIVNADQKWVVKSPDDKITLTVLLNKSGALFFNAEKAQHPFLDYSPLGILTSVENFTDGLTFIKVETQSIHETYSLPSGKKNCYLNNANEITLFFCKGTKEISIAFRVYNDGAAYRYQIPGEGDIQIHSELSAFRLPDNVLLNLWAQKYLRFYESTYDLYMPENLGEDHYGFPLLVQAGKAGWALLTEAAVYGDYCGCHLQGGGSDALTLKVVFAPDQNEPVSASLPFASPWRTAMIGDTLQDIVNSDLVENLNPPSEVEDTSWILPGRAAWSWYSDGKSCGDIDIQKAYVDFTADMGWEYSVVDGGWTDKLNVPELIDYAEKKGVKIWLWSHSRNFMTDEAAREKLSLWASWGVVGVKIDFFDSDAQEKIIAYDRIARIAAEYKIMINYHGSTKPSGERRRWPHILTREGIYGAEYLRAASEGPNAAHNCTVPFTRNVVGPMDYTPVTFSRCKNTTYVHQVALAVIFESHIQHFADSKEAYYESAAKEFLSKVPVSWDETLLLEGYPGRHVTMARRRGDEWYIGSICAAGGRKVSIPLDFLDKDSIYTATFYEDELIEDEYRFRGPTQILTGSKEVSSTEVLSSTLKIYGGYAARLVKKK